MRARETDKMIRVPVEVWTGLLRIREEMHADDALPAFLRNRFPSLAEVIGWLILRVGEKKGKGR